MKRVLIIDDDEGVRLTLQHVLAANGYAVWTAEDGVQGVDLARLCSADIVLTDLLMPRRSGLETIDLLKQEFPAIRIVAMSGGMRMGEGNVLEAASRCGADEVIAKPFDIKSLLELLPTLA